MIQLTVLICNNPFFSFFRITVEEDVIQEARTDNIDGSVVSTHQINGEDVLQGATAVNSNITIEDIKCLANDPKTLEKIESAKKFKFIVIGQTGIGKSTLINGLIGAEVAKVDEGLTTGGTTTEVESYTKKIENIEVVAYDSPGLEHGLGEDIYQTCREGAHLVIFAIPTTGKRFVPNNPDALTIVKFTRKLTPAIWKKTLVVLTQANTCETLNPHLRNKSKENKKEFFIRLVCDYKTAIHQTLKTTGVPAATVEKVKVVPVGHEYEPELLDGTLWFTNFWFECLTAIPTAEGRIAMTRVNILRFKSLNDVTDKDFQQSVHNQPIVVVRPKMTADDTVSIFVGSPAAGALALRFTDDAIELVTMPTGFKMGMVLGTIIL